MSDSEIDLPPPFAGATGRGLRVAVVDSGVHALHPHIFGVAGGVAVTSDGTIENGSFSDSLGHGTAVMAAIQEKAPEAEYYAVKLFHSSLRTTATCLLAAIQWAISQNMDVVNLSLGTVRQNLLADFKRLSQLASQAGTMLVSARESGGEPCLPGCLPGVFGVGLDFACNRNRFRCEATAAGPVYFASGYPRSLEGMSRQRNLNGISFAVANMTGFILRAAQHANLKNGNRLSAEPINQELTRELEALKA